MRGRRDGASIEAQWRNRAVGGHLQDEALSGAPPMRCTDSVVDPESSPLQHKGVLHPRRRCRWPTNATVGKKTPSSFYDAPTLHSHADGGPKHRAGAQARFVDVKREKKPTSKPWNCNALVPLASKGTDAAHTPSDSSRQVLPQRPMNRHPFLSSR